MTEKGRIFAGYVRHIINQHEFGTSKMVDVGPVYFTTLDDYSASQVLDELINDGWLREYVTVRTFSHGSRGFKVKTKTAFRWIGVTSKGWNIAQKYLDAGAQDEKLRKLWQDNYQ